MIAHRLHRDQTGLVGRIAVIWLLILALVLVAGFDAIAIAFTQFRTKDLAANAASTAAISYKQSSKADQACQAALAYVAEHDEEAKIPPAGCAIDPATGVATITVRKDASTLVAQRLSITRDYARVESIESDEPPI